MDKKNIKGWNETFRVMTTSGYFLFMQLKTYSNKRYRYVDSNLKVYHLTIGRKVCNGVFIAFLRLKRVV